MASISEMSLMGIEVTSTTFSRARVTATFKRRSPPSWPRAPKNRLNDPARSLPNLGVRVARGNAQARTIEGRVGVFNQLAVLRAVVNLKRRDWEAAMAKRQKVGAVLNLATVPGFLEDLPLSVRGAFVEVGAVEL